MDIVSRIYLVYSLISSIVFTQALVQVYQPLHEDRPLPLTVHHHVPDTTARAKEKEGREDTENSNVGAR